MNFPGKLFDASGDPAFDALDFGVSGQMLSCGNSFLLQGQHDSGKLITNKGPLCCVDRGVERMPEALWSSDLLPRKRMSGQFRRSTLDESDIDMVDNDGQDDMSEESTYLLRYQEHCMGNCLDSFILDDEDVIVAQVDVAHSDLKLSKLENLQGFESIRLRPLLQQDACHGKANTKTLMRDEIYELASTLPFHKKIRSDQTCLFATRRSRRVEFVSCELKREDGKVCVQRKQEAHHQLDNEETSKSRATCCVSFNPFWQEEACILNTDGTVDIWDAFSETVVGYSGMGEDARAAAVLEQPNASQDAVAFLRKLVLPFGHCVWGAHPRTVLCCQPYRISLLDLRSSSSSSELLRMPNHMLGQTGRLFSLCGGRDVDGRNSHEFIVSSSSLLCLFDIRQPAIPLLRWLHHQEFDPPRHLLQFQSSHKSVEEAKLLLTGSYQWGEIVCYQHGRFAEDAAPCSLGLPHKVFSIGDTNLVIPSRSFRGRPGEACRRVELRRTSEKQEVRDLRTLSGLSFSWQPSAVPSSSLASSMELGLVLQCSQYGEVFVQKVAAQGEEERSSGDQLGSWAAEGAPDSPQTARRASSKRQEAGEQNPEGYAGDDEEGAGAKSLPAAYNEALRVMVSTMKKEDVAVRRQSRAKALRTMNMKKVFEFGLGLRDFDGKVSKGARLPEPLILRSRSCESCGSKSRSHPLLTCCWCNACWHTSCLSCGLAPPDWTCASCSGVEERGAGGMQGGERRRQYGPWMAVDLSLSQNIFQGILKEQGNRTSAGGARGTAGEEWQGGVARRAKEEDAELLSLLLPFLSIPRTMLDILLFLSPKDATGGFTLLDLNDFLHRAVEEHRKVMLVESRGRAAATTLQAALQMQEERGIEDGARGEEERRGRDLMVSMTCRVYAQRRDTLLPPPPRSADRRRCKTMAAMSRLAEEEGAFNPRRFSRLSHRSRTRFSHEDVVNIFSLRPPWRYRDRPDGSVELLPTSQESQRAATSLMLELASKYHVYFGTIRDIWMKKKHAKTLQQHCSSSHVDGVDPVEIMERLNINEEEKQREEEKQGGQEGQGEDNTLDERRADDGEDERTRQADGSEEQDALMTLVNRLEREWEETHPSFRSITSEARRPKDTHSKEQMLHPPSSLPSSRDPPGKSGTSSLLQDSPAISARPSLLKSPTATPVKRNLSRIRRQSGAMGGGSGF